MSYWRGESYSRPHWLILMRRIYSLSQKVIPVTNAVLIANEDACRERARCCRFLPEPQPCFGRETISLLGVYFPVCEHAVLPRSFTATRPWHHVIDVAFAGHKLAAGVLAHASVAFPDS